MQTKQILITGKVQGVWYRQAARIKAIELGIKGTVQNQPNGSVVVVATGSPQQLAGFQHWCWQGPPRARVENVVAQECPVQVFNSFSII